MMVLRGRAWRFGDDVDTDAITPAKYLANSDPSYWAQHVLEAVRPEFAREVAPGDIVVAGHTFGSGSSREHAAIALATAGASAVVAESFSRIFLRNAFNNGLPALEVPGVSALVGDGDTVEIDVAAGVLVDVTRGRSLEVVPIPAFLVEMCDAGGLIPWLRENTRPGEPINLRAGAEVADHGR
jgi:3-isopropylmalate dehydratase small subunit